MIKIISSEEKVPDYYSGFYYISLVKFNQFYYQRIINLTSNIPAQYSCGSLTRR